MITYKPGDVVFCRFPYREDPLKFTRRPALVMKTLDGGKSYKMAQITCTDRRDKLVGMWIEKGSALASSMRLRESSFINLSNILEVDAIAIERFNGTCTSFSDLEKKCSDNGITY